MRPLRLLARSAVVPMWAAPVVFISHLSAAADALPTSPLRIEDAVQLALSRNERAKVSDFQVIVAEAAVERARAGFLPVIAISGSDQQHLASAGPTSSNVGASSLIVNQPIINAPAWPLYSQAKALADAQRAQNVDDKRLLAFLAANAFLAVLNADDFLQAAQRQLSMAKANLDDSQARAQAGLTSSNDVTRARIDIAGAARQVQANQGNFDNAIIQLAFAIAAPVAGPLAPPYATLSAAKQPPGQIDALVRFAMEHRPDVLAAQHAVVAARDFAREPLLRLVPTIGIQAGATATTNSAASGRWHDETLTGTLSWTLYDAGVRYADAHSRDAQASIADLNLRLLGRSVDAQVRGSAALLVSAQGALVVAEEAMMAARQGADEAAILYRQGLAKAIELVDANDTRFTTEINDASAEYTMAQAYLNLRQSLGLGPLETEPK